MKFLKALALIISLSFLTIACGAGGGGGGGGDSTPPSTTTVSGTVVDSGGSPISRASVTISSTPVTVITDINGNFSAEVEVGEHNIEISKGSTSIYSASITCQEGTPLTLGNISASYTKQWGTAEVISADMGNVKSYAELDIAFDKSGNAIAVWHQYDGTSYSIYANRYVAGSGWGTAELIETGSEDAENPKVAVDINGNAIAVWRQSNGVAYSYDIWANRYVAGTGWGTAELLETAGKHATGPSVGIDGNGNAIAVWCQNDGVRFNIKANRYVAGTGWGTAEFLETDTYSANHPHVAVDINGNAIAVWSQKYLLGYRIWANRYITGTGWGSAEYISTFGEPNYPHVGVDINGNAIVVWLDDFRIEANRYAEGSGWDSAELIDTYTYRHYDPRVGVDINGNAIAVWVHNTGTMSNVRANRYAAGYGWDADEIISLVTGSVFKPRVAVDRSGNAIAVWHQKGDHIRANRYVAGSWGIAESIETDTGGAFGHHVAVDINGNAIAVWRKNDGTKSNIWASRFD